MQITRQRMKPEMTINTSEICPSCDGTGKISSTLVLEDEIEKNLSYLVMQKHTGLTIEVHPILYAYLTKGFPSKRRSGPGNTSKKSVLNPTATTILPSFIFTTRVMKR